jgi:hypothetical protein
MNKFYGLKTEYEPVRKDASRVIVSYEKQDVDEIHCTWFEVYFNMFSNPNPSFEEIKEAVLADINARTDEKILSGFVWEDKPVWLSSENQFNFKAAYDLAVQTQGQSLPVKFKLGEDEQGNPVYHVFEDLAEFTDFYSKAIAYINQCINDGWERKDGIDWSQYEPKA